MSARPISNVAVVTPVYKAEITADERLTLARIHSVLSRYDRILAGPEQLLGQTLPWFGQFTQMMAFESRHFSSIKNYNLLLLSEDFYQRFERYDYILICQLDALPLHDALDNWCQRGFDYIGAPWFKNLQGRWFESYHRWRWQRRARLARAASSGRVDGLRYKTQQLFMVGNGGFSLRRVSPLRELLASGSAALSECRAYLLAGGGEAFNEDLFFASQTEAWGGRLRAPDYREAAGFALEADIEAGIALNRGLLPFGCHAWPLFRDDWQRVYQARGFDFPISAASNSA